MLYALFLNHVVDICSLKGGCKIKVNCKLWMLALVLWVGDRPKIFCCYRTFFILDNIVYNLVISWNLETFGMKWFPVPRNLTCLSVFGEIPGMSFCFSLPSSAVSLCQISSLVSSPSSHTVPFTSYSIGITAFYKLCTWFAFYSY